MRSNKVWHFFLQHTNSIANEYFKLVALVIVKLQLVVNCAYKYNIELQA